jgi:hypothetical protein
MSLLSSLNSHFTNVINLRHFMRSPSNTVSACSFRWCLFQCRSLLSQFRQSCNAASIGSLPTTQPLSRQTSFADRLSDADGLYCVLPYARYESEVRPITRKAKSLLRHSLTSFNIMPTFIPLRLPSACNHMLI